MVYPDLELGSVWLFMRNLLHSRPDSDNQELPCTVEITATIERKRNNLWPSGKDCPCCSWVRCLKVTLVLLATLILLNAVAGLNLGNPLVIHVMKRITPYPADVQNLFQRQEDRLQSLSENQCQVQVNDFSDSYNRTLRSFANMDTDEPRLKYALSELLDESFSLTLDRTLLEPRHASMRARFMLRLKTLAKNLRMSYDPRVLRRLVPDVKVHIDLHYQSINGAKVNLYQRYSTCAVVGNSGEVLNSTRGSFIDEHDAVIRLNNARAKPFITEGFPTSLTQYIGSKTTIMFMNSHILRQCSSKKVSCHCHPYGLQVPIVLYLCDAEHMLDVSICGSQHKAPLFVTDRRLDLLVTKIARWYSLRSFFNSSGGFRATKWRQWELLHRWEAKHKYEFHYSSGMEAVVFALGICKHVDIFGFGKNPNFHHHFHSLQRIEYYGHDFDAEYTFYDDLENGRVNANPFLCGAGTYIPPLRVFH